MSDLFCASSSNTLHKLQLSDNSFKCYPDGNVHEHQGEVAQCSTFGIKLFPRNSAVFGFFWIIPEISVNLLRIKL